MIGTGSCTRHHPKAQKGAQKQGARNSARTLPIHFLFEISTRQKNPARVNPESVAAASGKSRKLLLLFREVAEAAVQVNAAAENTQTSNPKVSNIQKPKPCGGIVMVLLFPPILEIEEIACRIVARTNTP